MYSFCALFYSEQMFDTAKYSKKFNELSINIQNTLHTYNFHLMNQF